MQLQIQKNEYNIEQTAYKKSNPADFSDIRVRMMELFDNLISKKEEVTIEDRINDKFLNLDFGSEFEIDATKIGVNDAIFFVNLLNQENLINYKVEDNNLSISNDNKSINVTQSLLNLLKTSYDSKKAIRLDFDSDVTVVLKLDNKGKIQAHFIPGTKECEMYLKNNIPSLKQTFDEQGINYSYLGYSNSRNRQKKSGKEKK